MIYSNNEQLVTELKKLFLDTKRSQRDIAKQMGISPQALQNLLNKKQLSFSDLKRVLDCINYDLLVDFSVRPISSVAKESIAVPQPDVPIRETLDEKLKRLRREHSTQTTVGSTE